jgi:transcriptional regulator with XRE-family HTH domain
VKPDEVTLGDLRKSLGVTQSEVAENMETSQAEVSMFENRDDHLASNLRRYIEALGGILEFRVKVNGVTVALKIK